MNCDVKIIEIWQITTQNLITCNMASALPSRVCRRCCVCGIEVLRVSTYHSLIANTKLKVEKREEDASKKNVLLNDIQALVDSVIDTTNFTCICGPCYRRLERIKRNRRDAENDHQKLLDDFKKIQNKENRTPTKAKAGKRQSEGTPSKTFSPKSAPSARKRTTLFSATASSSGAASTPSPSNPPVHAEVCLFVSLLFSSEFRTFISLCY